MPKNSKRSHPLVTRQNIYRIIAVGFVCYLFHLSTDVRILSTFVESDPNEVYYLLKDPINLLVLHPKAVEIKIVDRRSQMTLDFAEFYMTESLPFGNSTTLINLIANPVERKVTLLVHEFFNLLEISIEWNIYGINKGTKAYTQIKEEIRATCPFLLKYVIGEMLFQSHQVIAHRIQQKYSTESDIVLL